MCPLLAQLKIGFFSSFSAAAVYSTNETNKAGLKQSRIFRCLCRRGKHLDICDFNPTNNCGLKFLCISLKIRNAGVFFQINQVTKRENTLSAMN
jgi:hypothetical protein